MRKRTDAHRPSVIDPAQYVFVGVDHDRCDDVGAAQVLKQERERIEAFRRAMGAHWDHPSNGGCACCGAHCIYTAVFYYPAEKSLLRFGFICCEKMHIGDPKAFRSFKRAMKDWRDLLKGKTKAKGLLEEAGLIAAWELYQLDRDEQALRDRALVVSREYQDDQYACGCAPRSKCDRCCGHGYYYGESRTIIVWDRIRPYQTLVDMIHKLVKYGSLSDKQLAYLRVLVEQCLNWKARQEELARQREAERAVAADCPEGRQEISGVLIKVADHWSEWAQGEREVWTVKDDRGFVVWGNRPSGIYGAERKDRVSFRATLTPSDRDPKFGFYKRPSNATLTKAEVEHAT